MNPSGKPRVLVVDDNAANRLAFESILETDYSVVLADSGLEALELCRRLDFAVIVLDVRMPGMDGFETAEALRGREKTRSTPIIFTSAYDQTLAAMTRGYVAGATDYLLSPVEPDLLKMKVATYAQIQLRYEAFRLKIQELENLLQSLRAELAKRVPGELGLKQRIRELEAAVAELNRQSLAPQESLRNL